MDKMNTQEMISALVDGQLQGEAFAQGVETAARDAAAREAWHTYHLIGDVLRSGELAAGTAPAAFMSRLQLRLQQEQQHAVHATDSVAVSIHPVRATAQFTSHSANDSSFRWKLVAGVASVAAVAAMGWTVVGSLGAKGEQGQLAGAQPGTVLAGSERGVMIRDPRLDELLAAHRQFGGTSALQMPSGFLRNATFEGPAR